MLFSKEERNSTGKVYETFLITARKFQWHFLSLRQKFGIAEYEKKFVISILKASNEQGPTKKAEVSENRIVNEMEGY